MITFYQGDLRFNYRAVAVIINNNQVLIHQYLKDGFWALPGGRVELMEPAHETIKREMQEELGIDVRVERLLWIVENFYDYNNKSFHEVALYFLISTHCDAIFYGEKESFRGIEKDKNIIFKWHEIEALEDIELYPKFLQKSLKYLPHSTEYIVNYG
ncbi:MAG: NUDIX hydrolase [Potamolinea sp.]